MECDALLAVALHRVVCALVMKVVVVVVVVERG